MSTTRLNGIIRAWEQGKPALTAFSKIDRQSAIDMSEAPYDGIVFEMEHNPYDVSALGDALQYMLNRKQIAESGSVAPGVTPLARIPANGVEMNQSFAKQVLDRGVYGVITPTSPPSSRPGTPSPPAAMPVPRMRRCTNRRACAATARPTLHATGACPRPNTMQRQTSGRSRRRARSWLA
jgi:hypothetical protein